jgi:hypothetical protein
VYEGHAAGPMDFGGGIERLAGPQDTKKEVRAIKKNNILGNNILPKILFAATQIQKNDAIIV